MVPLCIRLWIMCIQYTRRSFMCIPDCKNELCSTVNVLQYWHWQLTALKNQISKGWCSVLFQWLNIHLKTAPPLWTRLSRAFLFPHPQPRKNAIYKIPAEVAHTGVQSIMPLRLFILSLFNSYTKLILTVQPSYYLFNFTMVPKT